MLGTQPVCRTRLPLPITPGPVPPADAVRIRPARTGDEQEVRRFLEGLSARTRELRFFAGMSGPSASLLRTLLVVDGRRDALLAVDGERVVGHGLATGCLTHRKAARCGDHERPRGTSGER